MRLIFRLVHEYGWRVLYYKASKMKQAGKIRGKNRWCIIKFMIELNIPGRGLIQLKHLVCDVNGTLAVDGQLVDGVKSRLSRLRDRLTVHLLTADTHGKQAIIDQQLGLKAVLIQPGDEASQKEQYLKSLGAETCAVIGQGANDAGMMRIASLGICVFSPEGSALETLTAADLVVTNILDALDLLEKPLRIVATLRK